MDLDLLRAYAKIGSDDIGVSCSEQIPDVLMSLFAVKRMLVVRCTPGKHDKLISCLHSAAESRQLDFEILNAAQLSSEDIRGQAEIVYMDGRPYSKRRQPDWWPSDDKGKMIVVENLGPNTDIELLRAFLYTACLGGDFDRSAIPDDKLPDSSGFIFLADNGFPFDRFAAISGYWREESAVLDIADTAGCEETSKDRAKFVRGLSEKCITEIRDASLFKIHLHPDIGSGEVFPTVRNERVDFYSQGGKLFSYSTRSGFVTHIKYASVLTSDRSYVSEADLPNLKPISSFSEQYSRIKENCGLYSGVEAQGVSRLLRNFKRVVAGELPTVIPLDIEICFDSAQDRNCEEDTVGRKMDRVDILFYNTVSRSLRFCEAKHFINQETWAEQGRRPRVVDQLGRYREQIKMRENEILSQYQRYVLLLNELLGLSLPEPLSVDDELPVFLLVFGFDSNQRDGRLRTLLLDDGSLENVPYYFCGDVGNVQLSNMWAGTKKGPSASAMP